MFSRMMALGLSLIAVGCSQPSGIIDKPGYRLETRLPAESQFSRIKILVIHYTADDLPGSLKTLTGPQVSAHYLIPDRPPQSAGKPLIWQLVPEDKLAWHAGVSFWRGATRINDTSIGIELENPGFSGQGASRRFYPFSPSQLAALEPLMKEIIDRYQIAPQNVVAHGDIAPQRKVDPGPLFPWQQLAQRGIGAWPDPARVTFWLAGRAPFDPVDSDRLLTLLDRYGYQVTPGLNTEQKKRIISAFQMHFRPADYRGQADAQTEAIAQALLEKYGQD